MNMFQKAAVAASTLGLSASAFAVEDPAIANITTKVGESMGSATAIVTTVGLALVALGFLGFILRIARKGSNGKV